MSFFNRALTVVTVFEVAVISALLALVPKRVDPSSKALAIWVPLTPAVYGGRSPFGDDLVPSSTVSKALAIWVPLTSAVYGDCSPFGDDPVSSTAITFLGQSVHFMLRLINLDMFNWYDLLYEAGFIIGEEVAHYFFTQFMILIWNMLIANTKVMGEKLNCLDIDLAPLHATIQLLFNGRPSALKMITMTSPCIVDKLQTYVEKRPPSAESRPRAPFEAGPPEPHNETESPGPSQSHSEISSSDDLIQHGSTAMIQMPGPVDGQLLTEPPVGGIANIEQGTQYLEPMFNMEKEIYELQFDEMSETLTTIATFPVDAQQPHKGFKNAVKFVRDSQSIIKLQAEGFIHVREIVKLVNQGVKDLTAKADFPVSKELSELGRSLEKLEASFVKRCKVELLTKSIDYINQIYMEGAFESRGSWFQCGPMVNRTAKQITIFLKKRQEYTENFLQEVRGLSDTYNINLRYPDSMRFELEYHKKVYFADQLD